MNPAEILQRALALLQAYVHVEPDPADKQRVAGCMQELADVLRKDQGEGEGGTNRPPAGVLPQFGQQPQQQPSPLALAASGRR